MKVKATDGAAELLSKQISSGSIGEYVGMAFLKGDRCSNSAGGANRAWRVGGRVFELVRGGIQSSDSPRHEARCFAGGLAL